MGQIDILITVFRNYSFLGHQIQLFRKVFDDYRILVCDTTPPGERNDIWGTEGIDELYKLEVTGLDGEIHGHALDGLVKKSKSQIVGICDSDFFWLKPGLLNDIREGFSRGLKCMGCAGWYPDWQKYIDVRWPERAGHLAPVVWGMFVDRDLAMEQTFVILPEEADQTMETGWRLRKRLIEENIPNEVFPGFKYEHQPEPEICFFGTEEEPLGMHFLKGSAYRTRISHLVDPCIEYGRAKWMMKEN